MFDNPFLRRRRNQRRAVAAKGTNPERRRSTTTGASRINLILSTIVAATSVALAIAIAAVMQWKTMQTQTEQNNAVIQQMRAQQSIMQQQSTQTDAIIEQMRLEQRAWLGVRQPSIVSDLVAGEPIEYVLPIHNSGNTPGQIVEVKISIVSRKLLEDIGPTIVSIAGSNDLLNQQTSIAPDATHNFLSETRERLGAGVLNATTGTSPSRTLYLLGWFKYLDVTGKSRSTQFCFRYDHESKKFVATAKYNVME